MKKLIILLSICISVSVANAQFVAKVEMKEKIEGICDYDNVYGLFEGFDGQVEPKCSVSKAEMQAMLNKVAFLKGHPKFKAKCMVSVYINCEEEAIGWRISVKTNPELDKQLLEVFKSYDTWNAGKLNGEIVDCAELISYKIKKGVLTIN